MFFILSRCVVSVLLLASIALVSPLHADESDVQEADEVLAKITVCARRVANTQPAGTYASLATALRFDPQIELQSRGLPEGQADVTVRGGVFENTGFVIGAVSIMDPQTGHYAAGLPIDPGSLSSPGLQTGIDNALTGFNANVATLAYTLPGLRDGGNVVLGFGDNNLWFSSARLVKTANLQSGNDIGLSLSAAHSQGDGTLPNGDHDFSRYNVQLQHRFGNSQTNLLLSYQDKFYAWPGAYTGFASLAEIDRTKTQFILADHRRDTSNGWFELSAYYRKLDDDYDFDRTTQESGTPGSFEHATRVYAVGFQGLQRGGVIDWRYGGQLTSDKLLRSTDLTEGTFSSRNYAKFSLVSSFNFVQSTSKTVTARLGATFDSSNRDSSAVSPLAGVTMQRSSAGGTNFFTIEYAATSQLPGYTALNSRPRGLFGGNAELGREKAAQLSLSVSREALEWTGSATVFYRKDTDLVDWTYFSGVPFSRQAKPVDLNVMGVELFATRQWGTLDFIAAYTYLNKDADYGSAAVDASFYALNYARHRATLALRYRLTAVLELRMDNEYRVQKDNPLRAGEGRTYFASLALAWEPSSIPGLELTLSADNLTNSDFQFFPGTPAVGRQLGISASYNWW